MKSGLQDNGRVQNELLASGTSEAVTGSKSLLPSSESDSFNTRHGSWNSVDGTSPGLSRVNTNQSTTSPISRQHSNQLIPQAFPEPSSVNSSYFSMPQPSTTLSSRSSQKSFLDPTSGSFVASGAFDSNYISRTSRHDSEEENRYAQRKIAFEGTDAGFSMQPTRPSFNNNNNNVSGYNSSAASRSGSIPPSRGDAEYTMNSTRPRGDMTNNHYLRNNTSNTSTTPHRPHVSAQPPPYSVPTGPSRQKYAGPLSPTQLNHFMGDFDKLNVGLENQPLGFAGQRDAPNGNSLQFMNGFPQDFVPNGNDVWKSRDDDGYQGHPDQFSPVGSGSGSMMSQPNNNRAMALATRYSHSPSNSDARHSHHHSPFYSNAGTPPLYQQRGPARGGYNSSVSTAVLERRLRGLQQEQQGYMVPPPNFVQFRNQYPHLNPYDFYPRSGLPMNQLHSYYPMPPAPNLLTAPNVPRGPARDHDVDQSQLMREFKDTMNKPNKRINELKDIYHHIVEFSGDQYGARFIQRELETANSDEKDQVYRELMTNTVQLMTDVFGNYVIQKFFEHGNQSQKRGLANQMKSHVVVLSCQMYGCRVVQKALEHILTDQQAQLIGELQHSVLKCVKDQNGNHVVQKAFERIPAEHIQFIINSFTGHVQELATHQYGCRVIQRMLEYCEEHTRAAVLQEVHASAASLIVDQYGNYVMQHIIEHGLDEDRARTIALVTSQLVNFSKHKFASNVVEDSIQSGSKEERQRIVAALTTDEKGQNPLQILITDQYGNYVIQKLLKVLKGSEWDEFVEVTKAQLALLKRFSYGKQIAAIEKLIYCAPFPPQMVDGRIPPPTIDTSVGPTPPLSTGAAQSPQSGSQPSTHASSIEGLNTSRKSSGSNVVGVLTPTST